MKVVLKFFLLIISVSCCGQSDVDFRVHKQHSIADHDLYYARTPDADVFHDNTWTYFLFSTGRRVCWFLNSQPPGKQNPNYGTGMVAGTFLYELHGDTMTFSRDFQDAKINQTVTDKFTCILNKDGMEAALVESVNGKAIADPMVFHFKLYVRQRKDISNRRGVLHR